MTVKNSRKVDNQSSLESESEGFNLKDERGSITILFRAYRDVVRSRLGAGYSGRGKTFTPGKGCKVLKSGGEGEARGRFHPNL